MPNERTSMRRIKELLRLQASGLKYRQMVGATGLSLGVISKYLQAAQAAGLAWPEVAELDEAVLSARLGGLAAYSDANRPLIPR